MTLHQIASTSNGTDIMSVDRVTVHRQNPPKIAKNDKPYSIVILKSAGSEVMLSLWESASKWKLPVGVELTLRGRFSKEEYQGSASLRCEELTMPEGSTEFGPEEIVVATGKPKITDCLSAGLRAAAWVTKEGKPEFSDLAFTFACHATMNGVRLE